MTQEIERAGIPTVIVTALDAISQSVGCYRIVPGTGVLHVAGDPTLSPAEEYDWRRRVVERALYALGRDVDKTELFPVVEAAS